jgi:hypothetical protein
MRPYALLLSTALLTMTSTALLHAAEADAPPPGTLMSDEGLRETQDHLLSMHALSDRILAAKDPKEKQKLKDEQLKLMKDFELKHYQRMQQHLQNMSKKTPQK